MKKIRAALLSAATRAELAGRDRLSLALVAAHAASVGAWRRAAFWLSLPGGRP